MVGEGGGWVGGGSCRKYSDCGSAGAAGGARLMDVSNPSSDGWFPLQPGLSRAKEIRFHIRDDRSQAGPALKGCLDHVRCRQQPIHRTSTGSTLE